MDAGNLDFYVSRSGGDSLYKHPKGPHQWRKYMIIFFTIKFSLNRLCVLIIIEYNLPNTLFISFIKHFDGICKTEVVSEMLLVWKRKQDFV